MGIVNGEFRRSHRSKPPAHRRAGLYQWGTGNVTVAGNLPCYHHCRMPAIAGVASVGSSGFVAKAHDGWLWTFLPIRG